MWTGIVLVVLLLLGGGRQPVAAQVPKPVGIFQSEQHRIASANGVPYDISVSLPPGYAESDAEYPVVYVTDPTYLFPQLFSLVWGPSERILVGVSRPVETLHDLNVARRLDFTPTRSQRAEERWARDGEVFRSGGGDEFLRVLSEDVRPFVEERYRVSETRGLVGYSLGGLFAAYVLVTAPESFTHYLMVSPWLVYDGGLIARLERAYAERANDLDARVYISVGTQEMFPDVPDARMLSRTASFAEILESRGYPNLTIELEVFPGEDHDSVIPLAMSRGLRSLFESN